MQSGLAAVVDRIDVGVGVYQILDHSLGRDTGSDHERREAVVLARIQIG